MKIVIFGLTISSSWGNGHATNWRGLVRALGARGHQIIFFERDVPYYAAHRDLFDIAGGRLQLYDDWESAASIARRDLADADVAMVTSYCPDGIAASDLVLESRALRVFYDLDTPVTLEQIEQGNSLSYIGPRGLADFDLVLSYTGGRALDQLRSRLGARRVAPLYGSVDPEVHYPRSPQPAYRGDLSYIGTYAEDRQPVLESLFLEPARRLPERRFVIAGAQYPQNFPWGKNIYFVRHVSPPEHAALYCSSRMTLNVTRSAMVKLGYCPSGRLFEAAACGTPVLSDSWEGLDSFFEPGEELLVAQRTEDTLQALELGDGDLRRLATRARARALEEHSAARRAEELETILSDFGDNVPKRPAERSLDLAG